MVFDILDGIEIGHGMVMWDGMETWDGMTMWDGIELMKLWKFAIFAAKKHNVNKTNPNPLY